MKTNIKRILPIILPLALVAVGVGAFQKRATASHAAPLAHLIAPDVDRDAPLVPRDRPDLAVYSSRNQGESQTQVYVQSTGSLKANLVYVDPDPGELVAVSDDGTRGTYRRYLSPGKSVDVTVALQPHQS